MEKLYQNILLPVDGSQQSIDAFKTGIRQAKIWSSNVFLVQVLSDENIGFDIKERLSFLDALEAYANREGVTLYKEIIYGEPRTQIAENLVDRWGIDLIIIGATGKGRLAKMLIGSVTSYVVQHAKCDIIISR